MKKCCLKNKRQRWDFCGVHVVTIPDKVRRCEIRRALNAEALRLERSQLQWLGHVSGMSQEGRTRRQALLATPTGK